MHKSKLIDLLKSLSAVELRGFSEYVHSPFFNKHPRLIQLIDMLREEAPLYDSDAINKENMYPRLFGKEAYQDTKITDLMSYLVKLLENYLAFLHFTRDPIAEKQFLLTELRERELPKHFESNIRDLEKLQHKYPYRDTKYYFNQYSLESEREIFLMKSEIRERHESLQKKVDNLDIFYLACKLKDSCEMINRKNIISVDYQLRALDDLLAYLKNNVGVYEEIPAITVYYKILLTLTESENTQHFSDLKHLLDEHASKFSQDEARQMYSYAENYCIKKLNSGETSYLGELFALYKKLIAGGLIFEGKYLSQWDYKNIVSVGTRLEEFDWTEKFIHEYKNKIAPESRDNAFSYNLALLYYTKRDYGNALKLLQKVEFTDVYYHLGAKSMLLKIYYDTDQAESFYSLIDAFKIYLKRNKLISEYQQNVHMNLIRFTRMAYHLKHDGNTQNAARKKHIAELKKNIEATKQIANIQWLLEKIDELES